MTNINFKTYNQLALDIRSSIQYIPLGIDLVVGIPRSGMIPAYMIGQFLNLKVASLDEYLNEIETSNGERPLKTVGGLASKRKVLIVDDSINSGVSLQKVKEKLAKYKNEDFFTYYAVYATEKSKNMVDIYGAICDQPRIFQWNYLNHAILSQACVDIDGVLCVDPTEEENDDGEKYINFILNAKPLYLPKYKIMALVTSRLEKYRRQTEEWLSKNGVIYGELFMLDLPNKEERVRLNNHGDFKAKIYSKLETSVLFIESNQKQAEKIAKLTNKPVVCVSNDEFLVIN